VLQFGTDGIRGHAETELPRELVESLARATVRVTGATRVLVARDTRESGPRIAADLARGFAAEGAVTESAGVLPTPGLAMLSRVRDEWAAMISASHNPWNDNGVKFFAPGGTKLSDEHQAAIESELRSHPSPPPTPGVNRPRRSRSIGAPELYEDYLRQQVTPGVLRGLRVVLDCGHGAAYVVAPSVFRSEAAVVHALHVEPNGRNINDDCGSTFPQRLQAVVVADGADLGFAFDGDADRVIAVDAGGDIVDGDQIMAIMALWMRERGELSNDAVVISVMSNLGLRIALAEHAIDVVETPVGDRHVVAAMATHGLALGGEQSGHIIFGARAGTGDGTLTALLLAERVATSGRSLAELASVMTRLPQVLVNVRLPGRPDLTRAPAIDRAIATVRNELGQTGRVLVRPSGTEPIVRIMVEAKSKAQATAGADLIADALRASFGGRDMTSET